MTDAVSDVSHRRACDRDKSNFGNDQPVRGHPVQPAPHLSPQVEHAGRDHHDGHPQASGPPQPNAK